MESDDVTTGEQRDREGHHGWASRLKWPGGRELAGRITQAGPTDGMLIKAGSLEYDRVLFFSDAVFAIAITLLVVDLRVPVSRTVRADHVLRAAVPEIVGFGIGFGVIGLFWLAHHSMWRHITAINGPLIMLNLLFLGTVAFMPYPTALLNATSAQVPAIVFFASCVASASLAEFVLWVYAAWVPGLVSAGVSRRRRRFVALQTLQVTVVFLASIPVAIVAPHVAEYLWIMVWVLGRIINRFARGDDSVTPG